MSSYRPSKGSRAIAVCDRCGFKSAWDDLNNDPNIPGLKVCSRKGCRDTLNLWEKGYRVQDSSYILPWTRPDVSVATDPNSNGGGV